jgi:threonine dehydrogenase-like Zn-dependent dehydrogenase
VPSLILPRKEICAAESNVNVFHPKSRCSERRAIFYGTMKRFPDTVRAAVIPAPGAPVEIRHLPLPTLETGGVLLQTIISEVCGTDVHLWHGKLAGVPYPLIPGHVSVGAVLETGGPVTDSEGRLLKEGDIVTFLDVVGTCHVCRTCSVMKASTRCPHRRVYGITLGAEDGLYGGWAENIYLRPGTQILTLPSAVSPDQWIGGGCGLPTATHAIELAQIKLADRVLIQGSGPVGLSACALALLSGAGWVGVIGAPELRLEAARRFGADWTMDVTATTPEERLRAVRESTGGYGPDIVIEASGNPDAFREGCELVRDAGRYIVVGQYTDNGDVSINPHLHINKKHLEVRGCWGSDFSHLWRAMETLRRFGGSESGKIDWGSLITHRYSLEEAGQALRDVEAGRVVKAVIQP